MLENLLKTSLDNDVINNYLRLLALRQVQLENQVERLSAEIQRQNFQQAERALLSGAQPAPQIVSMTVELELMVRLLDYLPAIFPQFWSSVSPHELAEMLGLKEKLVIPSPFVYPDIQKIVAIMEHIKWLPEQEQSVIADLCYRLQKRYNLKSHPISGFWLTIQTSNDREFA